MGEFTFSHVSPHLVLRSAMCSELAESFLEFICFLFILYLTVRYNNVAEQRLGLELLTGCDGTFV